MNPRLATMPRWRDEELRPYRWLDSKKLDECMEAFARSWYAHEVAPPVKPTPEVKACDWWSHWQAAALCEELRRRGCRLRVAR